MDRQLSASTSQSGRFSLAAQDQRRATRNTKIHAYLHSSESRLIMAALLTGELMPGVDICLAPLMQARPVRTRRARRPGADYSFEGSNPVSL